MHSTLSIQGWKRVSREPQGPAGLRILQRVREKLQGAASLWAEPSSWVLSVLLSSSSEIMTRSVRRTALPRDYKIAFLSPYAYGARLGPKKASQKAETWTRATSLRCAGAMWAQGLDRNRFRRGGTRPGTGPSRSREPEPRPRCQVPAVRSWPGC